jgi:cbb3-type cytochrome oxidase maturation protein
MNALVILILASLFVATCFLIAFIWAVKSGQFEDRYTPSMRMLFEDKEKNDKNYIE